MNPRTIWVVFRKELLDIIRDRRTVIFMIVLPLMLIPGLFYLMSSFTIGSEKKIASTESRVGIIGAEDAPVLVDFLKNQEKEKYAPKGEETEMDAFLIENQSGVNAFLNIVPENGESESEAESGLGGALTEDRVPELLAKRNLDAVLVIPPGFENQLGVTSEASGTDKTTFDQGLSLRIEYVSTNDKSKKAYSRLKDSLDNYRKKVVESRLAAAGYDDSMIEPFKTAANDNATAREKFGDVMGRLLPYIIILMTFAGATFPAISLAAGEKEQKTLETLLACPASRVELVLGKFMVIVVAGLISSVFALIGLYYGFSKMRAMRRIGEMFTLQMDITSIVLAFLAIIPLAVLFAGLLLTLSVFARSYREAQGYIGPLNFLVILPAFASFLPGVELNFTLSLVPVMNVSLVMRQILAGKAMEIMPYYGMTVLSTLVLAALAVWLCAAMFKKESAIFKI